MILFYVATNVPPLHTCRLTLDAPRVTQISLTLYKNRLIEKIQDCQNSQYGKATELDSDCD